MRRGDIVIVALQGDESTPRPALVIQADTFDELPGVTVLPLTSDLREAPGLRLSIDPAPDNGLARRSQVMVDKVQTPLRSRVRGVIGRLDDAAMVPVTRALAIFLGFG